MSSSQALHSGILLSSTVPHGVAKENPYLLFVEGEQQRQIPLQKVPFTIGRRPEKDLIVPDPRVSRDHAEIILVDGEYCIVDQGSKHGTFVNGQQVHRHRLANRDRIHFGSQDHIHVVFHAAAHGHSSPNATRQFLSQISGIQLKTEASDLEKLTFFLDVARRLNTSNALEEVLVTLLDATLRITGAERGFVFLRGENGDLRLAVGRTAKGDPLHDDTTISRSIVMEAASSASRVIVTDTASNDRLSGRESIIAHDLRTVICMPLLRAAINDAAAETIKIDSAKAAHGVLYLDSRFVSQDISKLSRDILNTVATEAAGLIEAAQLAHAEEQARMYQKELSIAASIQQRLMTVVIPEVHFAAVKARSLACNAIGGDFYDVMVADGSLIVVVADICGKGVSAALLASILQGMIYSQVIARVPLSEIASAVNRFMCMKQLGEKYATVFMLKISPEGGCEYVNCGHVPPVIASRQRVERLTEANLPLGLLPDAAYTPAHLRLEQNDRIVIVSDGVTEAQNSKEDFFGDERMEATLLEGHDLYNAVTEFAGDTPASDDCTIVEVSYQL
ncbi:MAG TPA: SpoIIE family protein phosphatase [Terriglobales bacterium]